MQTKTQKQLSAHIARIEGQLAAARAALEADDCGKTARTLFAASRSLSSLRAMCIDQFLSNKVYRHSAVRDKKLLTDVQSLMRA